MWADLLAQSKLLNKQGIYLVPGKDRAGQILKVRNTNPQCLQHEYLVGTKLNSYSRKYGFVIETIDYGIEDNRGFLLLSNAPGVSFHLEINKLTDIKTRIKIFHQLFLELEQLGRLCPFTHYDIHLSNIHINRLPHRIRKRYQPSGLAAVEIETEYELYLLDYAYSHHSEIQNTWVEVKATSVCSGSIPSVYDPVYDLYAILGKAQYYLHAEDEALSEAMLADKFVPYIGDRKQTIVWGRVGKEFIYDLLPVPNHALFDKVFYTSSHSAPGGYKELLGPIVSTPAGKFFSPADQRTAQEIGARLRYTKEQCIARRKNSRTEVVQLGLVFFNRLLSNAPEKPPRLEFKVTANLRSESDRRSSSSAKSQSKVNSKVNSKVKSKSKPVRSIAQFKSPNGDIIPGVDEFTAKPTRTNRISRSTRVKHVDDEFESNNQSRGATRNIEDEFNRRRPSRKEFDSTRNTEESNRRRPPRKEFDSTRNTEESNRRRPSRKEFDSTRSKSNQFRGRRNEKSESPERDPPRKTHRPFVSPINEWTMVDDDEPDYQPRRKEKRNPRPIKVQFK